MNFLNFTAENCLPGRNKPFVATRGEASSGRGSHPRFPTTTNFTAMNYVGMTLFAYLSACQRHQRFWPATATTVGRHVPLVLQLAAESGNAPV